jgi:hypothetical protein
LQKQTKNVGRRTHGSGTCVLNGIVDVETSEKLFVAHSPFKGNPQQDTTTVQFIKGTFAKKIQNPKNQKVSKNAYKF